MQLYLLVALHPSLHVIVRVHILVILSSTDNIAVIVLSSSPFFPGSHDSFTFWVDVHAPVGPDQKAYVKYLATMFNVLAKKVMVKWSMTQVPI